MKQVVLEAETTQEAFDRAYQHMVNQGKQSVTANPNSVRCCYDGPADTQCAIGCLISNADDRKMLDKLGLGLRALIHKEILATKLPVEFLKSLQNVHDSDLNWDDDGFGAYGHVSMDNLARKWGFVYTQPTRKKA